MDTPAPDSGPAPVKPSRWVLWLGVLVLLAIYAVVSRPRPSQLKWQNDLPAAIADAGQSQKPILVDFYADWCGPCKMMEESVFSKPEFAQATEQWITVQINVDRQPQIAKEYGITSIPTFVILSPAGQEVAREGGVMSMQDFTAWLASSQSWPRP